jgi:hypothetical protein
MQRAFAGFTVGVLLAIAGNSSASGVATTSNVVVNGDFNLTALGSGIVFPGGVKQTEAVTPDTYQKRIAAACNTGYAVTAVDASGNVTCTPINPGWVISNSDMISGARFNVGIGTKPTSPLTVGGTIETISGGFKFPDGTLQTSAFPSDAYQKRVTAICPAVQAIAAIDVTGNVTCTPVSPGWAMTGKDMISQVENIGIRVSTPTSPLTVGGNIEITYGGLKFPNGTIQTSVGDCHGRYEDNGDGTVSDCRTGLIWLKDANCAGTKNWADASVFVSALVHGACGLTDGSAAGDWRLPTRTEWMAMVAYAKSRYSNPALTNAAGTAQWADGDPFLNVQSSVYFSSSSDSSNGVWGVLMDVGYVTGVGKIGLSYVWPVRAGQ